MGLKVLVVDDSAFMRTMIKNILTKKDCAIVEASNGEEAISRYKEITPDLVFMDVIMPVMNGIDALKGIRQINPQAKIVMCTSVGGQEKIVDEAVSAGATDFITKPFKPEEINNVVDNFKK